MTKNVVVSQKWWQMICCKSEQKNSKKRKKLTPYSFRNINCIFISKCLRVSDLWNFNWKTELQNIMGQLEYSCGWNVFAALSKRRWQCVTTLWLEGTTRYLIRMLRESNIQCRLGSRYPRGLWNLSKVLQPQCFCPCFLEQQECGRNKVNAGTYCGNMKEPETSYSEYKTWDAVQCDFPAQCMVHTAIWSLRVASISFGKLWSPTL